MHAREGQATTVILVARLLLRSSDERKRCSLSVCTSSSPLMSSSLRQSSGPPPVQSPQRYGYINDPSARTSSESSRGTLPPRPPATNPAAAAAAATSAAASSASNHSRYIYESDASGVASSPSNGAYEPVTSPPDYSMQHAPADFADDSNPFEQNQSQHFLASNGSSGGGELPVAANNSFASESDGSQPAPFESRRALYVTYALSAWGDRMWEFAAIVFVISLYPSSLFYSALFGLVENLVGILFGPWVGSLVDSHDRLVCMRWAILGQNGAIALAGGIFWASLASLEVTVDPDTGESTTTTTRPGWIGLAYVFILAAGGVAKVASTGAKVALHKDWVPVLASRDPQHHLTILNSSMRRIDLCCSILAPLLVGLVSSLASESVAVAMVAFWALGSLVLELRVIRRTYAAVHALQHKPRAEEAALERAEAQRLQQQQQASESAARGEALTLTSVSTRVAETSFTLGSRVLAFGRAFLVSMRNYRAHPVFLASASYALLYVSVLSLGGTMTSWLKLKGVSDAVLAACRGTAAIVGVGATFATPGMIERWGLLHAGVVAIWLQVLTLVPVSFAFVYYFRSGDTQLVLVLLFLCLSRFGLWSFDLVETQLMQAAVIPSESGALNGAQESAMNVSYTVSFILTMIFSSKDTFVVPVWISFVAVIISACMFSSYVGHKLGGGGGGGGDGGGGDPLQHAFPALVSFDPRKSAGKDFPAPPSDELLFAQQQNHDHEQWQHGDEAQQQLQDQGLDQQQQQQHAYADAFERAPGGAYVPDVADVYAGSRGAAGEYSAPPLSPSAPPLPSHLSYRYEDDY